MRIGKSCFGLLVAASLLAALPVGAQQEKVAVDWTKGSGIEALMRMADFLSRQERFSVTIHDTYDVVQESGEKIEFGDLRKITMVRPQRLRVDVTRSDGDKGQVVFDGKAITAYSPNQKVYGTSAISGDIDQAVTHFVRDLQMKLPLAMMFVTRLPQEIDRRVISAEIVEACQILDTPCLHVIARTEQVDFQVWVPTHGDPLPRRVVITYKEELGQPQFRALFSDWNLAPEAPDSLFTLSIPQDAKKIEFLSKLRPVVKPAAKKGGKK